MSRFTALIALVLALAPYASSAQAQQPYAGFELRSIKALSDQQVADLKAGRGMGLALAAELNGYQALSMSSISLNPCSCPRRSARRCRSCLRR